MPEGPFTSESGPGLPADRDFSDPLAVFDLFWKPVRALMKVYTNHYCHLFLSKAVHPGYFGWMERCYRLRLGRLFSNNSSFHGHQGHAL